MKTTTELCHLDAPTERNHFLQGQSGNWNALPPDIVSAESLESFKTQVAQFFA
ncbi:hypothetical protein DPMN_087048 [Dreissena polymorpha]|uniref:Uncharacterized protein n=1 Tax=Dreissena polymorpha TaxID=45954 RepID=A0A9D4QV49_DREPO|nr:hypothetical protein DPMN_087048 [Dreissena polymorpha]